MSVKQFIGYQMAARVAAEWRDRETFDQINAIMAKSAMKFVLVDGELKLTYLTLTEVIEAVA